MKAKIAPALKSQAYFIEQGKVYKGGWTRYKTEKARSKMFYNLFTMVNDVKFIDFIGTRFDNYN